MVTEQPTRMPKELYPDARVSGPGRWRGICRVEPISRVRFASNGLLASLRDAQSEYYSAVEKTDEEARKLKEEGFEYVCTTPEGTMLSERKNRV